MKSSAFKSTRQGGFSLVEMLVVIAVFGIIAAIALPNISRINSTANKTTAKWNAQNIALLSSSANAAGAWHVIPESLGGGVEMSVDVLVKGVKSPDLLEMTLKIELGSKQIKEADEFLEIANIGDEYVLQYTS